MKAAKVSSIRVKAVLAFVVIVASMFGVYTDAAAESPKPVVLPAGMQIPSRLPRISDPDLMAGWLWLWNTEAGRPIAEHIRDNKVTLEYWNGPVNSAPVKPVKVNGRSEVRSMRKIQISDRTPQTRHPAILAGMLAHEGYHSQLPFGPNLWPGSIYEEFRAYKLQQDLYTELHEKGWTGPDTYYVQIDPSGFDPDNAQSLADYGRQLGEAYAKCRLYPWSN